MGSQYAPARMARGLKDLTLFDTDVLIDAGRGINDAVDRLKEVGQGSILAISVISQMELIVGCRNKSEIQATDKFLKQFQVIKVDMAISDTAVLLLRQYKLSHGLLIADCIIAATAVTLDIPFIFKNQRDYNFIAGLNLLPYP